MLIIVTGKGQLEQSAAKLSAQLETFTPIGKYFSDLTVRGRDVATSGLQLRFAIWEANQNQAKGKGKKTTATRRGMPSFKAGHIAMIITVMIECPIPMSARKVPAGFADSFEIPLLGVVSAN